MNQNDRLIKFGQSILWSMVMLKREITFIVTIVNRMLQARSLHGKTTHQHITGRQGSHASLGRYLSFGQGTRFHFNVQMQGNVGFVMTRCVNCSA